MSRSVVVVVFSGGPVGRVNRFIESAAAEGVAVTVLTAEGGQAWTRAEALHPAARSVSIGPGENRRPFVRLSLALERGPGALLRRAGARLPGAPGKALGKAASAHAKAARLCRRRLFWPVYRVFRGRALRRLALRRVGDLGLDRAERVVIVDDAAVPFGWTLARRRPDLEVTRRLPA
ncbi:hypothetical protein [Glycomyces sp. NRRL B-16210]|uniref:hypothetical protein n=1 Tax=Glycomyces sp. NRRL B-16210 TaxID=1463821 RepID=UPI0004C0C13B|nr:hypothetical protein [Glycomyces sp. NRRL B-16210]